MMGKITCANVLSDLFAMGVVNCDSLIMLISVCTQMTEKERDAVMPLIVQGFRDNATLANVKPICQTSAFNPWCIIGGAASSVCQPGEFILPSKAQVGDAIILTKPVGAQMACNAHRWAEDENQARWDKISRVVSKEDVDTAFEHAVLSMARLNIIGAELMHKYQAHAATDVTGFGLLGHANNLAESQQEDVQFVIHTIPVIAKMTAIAQALGNTKFLSGTTPETSGGLLICLPNEHAQKFCNEIEKREGWPAWTVGEVVQGNKTAKVLDNPTVIEVTYNKL